MTKDPIQMTKDQIQMTKEAIAATKVRARAERKRRGRRVNRTADQFLIVNSIEPWPNFSA